MWNIVTALAHDSVVGILAGMTKAVVFLQGRTHRAGAQTCLMRLLRHKEMRRWNPVLVCSAPGWLTRECERENIPVVCEAFPRSRSLYGRWFGNARFVDRVVAKLRAASVGEVGIVHANDHIEALLGLRLAGKLRARGAVFLRSPGMTWRDYWKYRCNEYDFISAVGDELLARAHGWDPERPIDLIYDGLEAGEFAAAKPKPDDAPTNILVIGSPLDWKGWADLTEALYRLEQDNALPPMRFDFTGNCPDATVNDLKLSRLRHHRCNFLGRVEGFRDLVRGYDLVINPTRMESFGMAALEVLAAGVPLLSSRTGVIEQVQRRTEMLFPPHQPRALADALKNVILRWTDIDFGVPEAQGNIRRLFSIDNTASRIADAYRRLIG
jgi:glycosyltransferase involved in cell wall biosynthesis